MTQHSRKMERAAAAPRLDRKKAGGAGGGVLLPAGTLSKVRYQRNP